MFFFFFFFLLSGERREKVYNEEKRHKFFETGSPEKVSFQGCNETPNTIENFRKAFPRDMRQLALMNIIE